MATKKELLAEAQEKGLDVSESNTKAEIQAALDAGTGDNPGTEVEGKSYGVSR